MVNKLSHIFLFVLSTGLLVACNKSYSPVEYKTWIESGNSGLFKSKRIGELEYSIQYETNEYLLLLEKGPVEISKCDLQKELDNFSNDHKVRFTIKNLNGIPPLKYNLYSDQEYYARIQYLNSQVSNDCYMLSGKDTLKCLFAHMDQDFGISPEMRLNFSFETSNEPLDLQFCFEDHLFNNGMIRFTIDQDDLENLPDLKIES